MDENLNFPVKYAVLELKSAGGYATNYESITEGFIASKCYIFEFSQKYLINGNSKVSYKVYFPYNDIAKFIKYDYCQNKSCRLFPYQEERKNIGINADGEYYPVTIVTQLFDTFEEAKAYADSQNSDLKAKLCVYISILNPKFKEEREKALKEFQEKIAICEKYETFITENTKDMIVTKDENLEKVIKLERKKDN